MSDLDYSNLSDENETLQSRIKELESELSKRNMEFAMKSSDAQGLEGKLAKLEASRDEWKSVAAHMSVLIDYDRTQEALAAYDAALNGEGK